MLKGFRVGPIFIECVYEDVTYEFRLNQVSVLFSKGQTLKMKLTLPDDSEVPFVLPTTGLDSRGNPVPLKVPCTIDVSDTKLLTIVQPDPNNPASGILRAVGPIGTGQVAIKDPDPDTQNLMVVVDVEVVPGALVSLGNPTFGEVRKSTETPPLAP